ncbi:MAG: cytidine deaminase [Bryobacteraceae bacterium]
MDRLVEAALEARLRARAPYSGFRVGAALEEAGGRIFSGCNVESASYGLTMCAERVAAFRAVAEGARQFTRLVVAADSGTPTPPCGACRQVLWELCGDVEILLVNLQGAVDSIRLSALFPRPFDAKYLD